MHRNIPEWVNLSCISCTGVAAASVFAAHKLKSFNEGNRLYARNFATPGGYRYPAGSNFPELRGHNNAMADVLKDDPGVSRT